MPHVINTQLQAPTTHPPPVKVILTLRLLPSGIEVLQKISAVAGTQLKGKAPAASCASMTICHRVQLLSVVQPRKLGYCSNSHLCRIFFAPEVSESMFLIFGNPVSAHVAIYISAKSYQCSLHKNIVGCSRTKQHNTSSWSIAFQSSSLPLDLHFSILIFSKYSNQKPAQCCLNHAHRIWHTHATQLPSILFLSVWHAVVLLS